MSDDTFVEKFLKASGYKASAVIHSDEQRGTVVTSNGGKYRVSRSGAVQVLGGPQTPKQIKAAQEAASEE